jgi:hypothetical protein
MNVFTLFADVCRPWYILYVLAPLKYIVMEVRGKSSVPTSYVHM